MHNHYMEIALDEAKAALEEGNLPVGCCIVLDGKVIARGRNTVDSEGSDLNHAELSAIRSCEALLFKNKRKAVVYTTLEPCAMCAGALAMTSVAKVVYAASDRLVGALELLRSDDHYQRRFDVVSGVLADEAQALLNEYVDRSGGRRHLKG